jgi:chemotaxis protein MotB
MSVSSRLSLVCLTLLCLAGCVGQEAFQKKVDEVSALTGNLADARRKNDELSQDNEKLRAEVVQMKGKLEEVEGNKKKLENLLSKRMDGNAQQIAELVREKETLKDDISSLMRSREERVRDVSRTYEMLLETMKDHIASGRISVTELRGTVTVSFADGVLFDGTGDDMKPAASTMLKTLAEVLNRAGGEREIRIEAPFLITGKRDGSGKGPYPWDGPAARSVTVAGFLRQQGIVADALSVAVTGDFNRTVNNGLGASKGNAERMLLTISPRE